MEYRIYEGKDRAGFSLLELLLYISIVSGITLVLAAAFLSLGRGRGQVESRGEVNSNLNFAVEKISQDLRAASAVTTPSLAGSSSPNLVATVSGLTVEYCVAGGQIRREAGGGACAGSSQPITSSNVAISSMNFMRLENTNSILSKTMMSIEVTVNASYNNGGADWQYSESKKTTIALP